MFYSNQNNYPELKYASKTHPNATIKTSGCGVVSCAIAINNLFNKQIYSVQQMRDFALECGARVNEGTDVNVLLNALCKAHSGLSFKTTNDETALVNHLKNGGIAIANQGDKYNVFSTAGHFVVLVGMVGNNINVYDPQMYNGKYEQYNRSQRIVKKTDYGCIVSVNELSKAVQDRNPEYYLISLKKESKKMYYEEKTMKTNANVYADSDLTSYVGKVFKNEKVKYYGTGEGNPHISYSTPNGYKVGFVKAGSL